MLWNDDGSKVTIGLKRSFVWRSAEAIAWRGMESAFPRI